MAGKRACVPKQPLSSFGSFTLRSVAKQHLRRMNYASDVNCASGSLVAWFAQSRAGETSDFSICG